MARILVVDDETEIRDLIKDVLVVGGHSIETAANGAAALALLRGKRYDVVILDRNMPGISGIEVLAQLRRLPSCKGVKVMMCTASGTMGDVDDALSAGADDYLVKPLDLALMQQKVTRLCPPPGAAPEPEPETGGLKGLLRRILPPQS